MHSCKRLMWSLLGGSVGLLGFLVSPLWSPLASPAAHAAPGGACSASAARDTARFGAAAQTALLAGRRTEAWRNVHNAVRTARRGGCSAHRSLGRAYLVLGIIEHQSGRYTRMYSAWNKALGLDRALTLDPRFANTRLRTAFYRLRKKLVPTAVTRPRPRPRPRPRARTQPRPRPRAQPEPGDLSPAPRTPDPPERPATRPAPEPTPDPYADRPRTQGGCNTDQDCKGSRICDSGRCTYSHAPTPTPVVGGSGGYGSGGGVRRAPVPIKRKGRYSDRGCVELGLGIGLNYSETSNESDGDDIKFSELYFALDLYLGYFVTNRFKLGFYFSTPIIKRKFEGDGYFEDFDTLSWEIDLIGAPGFAWPFSDKVYGFADFLLGFAATGGDSSTSNRDLVLGVVGGELGLKFLLGKHLLMRLGLKPIYLFGKDRSVKIGNLRVIVALGFSAFW